MIKDQQTSTRVYASCIKIFEGLECKKEIYGNGHHAAQNVAQFAVEELKKRWCDKHE